MTTSETLYAELKPELEIIAEYLFSVSEDLLRMHGNFLPHAAVLTEEGKLRIVAVAPPNEATHVLAFSPTRLRQALKDLWVG